MHMHMMHFCARVYYHNESLEKIAQQVCPNDVQAMDIDMSLVGYSW